MFDLEGYLQSKNIQFKRAPGNNLHTQCFFHGEDPHKRGRLYIRTGPSEEEIGLYFCQVCGEKGNLYTLRRHFGDDTTKQIKIGETHYNIFRAATDFYQQALTDEAKAYLKERGFTKDTIADFKLGFSSGYGLYSHLKEKNFDPAHIKETGLFTTINDEWRETLEGRIVIPYLVSGSAVTLRGMLFGSDREKGAKYKSLPNTGVRLFNTDVLWKEKEVIIAEGECDTILLTQKGYNAVGVPGAGLWQDSWNSYFKDVRRIFVAFDSDTAGRKGVERIRENLGTRIRSLDLPEGQDVSDFFLLNDRTKEDFEELLKRQSGGLLISVEDAMKRAVDLNNLPGLKLGFPTLDRLIRPGMRPHQIMVPFAREGSGKTTFLVEVMRNVLEQHQDHKILFMSLELTAADWVNVARKQFQFYHLTATEKDFKDFYNGRFMVVEENRITEDQLEACLDDFIYEMGQKPDLIVLDYLGYYAAANIGGDSNYQKVSKSIMGLKAISKSYGVPIIAPHQVSTDSKHGEEPTGSRDSGIVRETADFALGLWNPDNAPDVKESERKGELRVRLQKSRHGNQGAIIDLQFAPISLAIVESNHALAARARREVEWMTYERLGFEAAIERHRNGI
jgi:hypothetical protein